MTKKTVKTIRFLFLLSGVLIATNFLFAAMQSGNYQIWADTFSVGGGDDLSSTNYQLADTLGETGIGVVSSTAYSIKGGYREIYYFRGREVLTLTTGASSIEFGELATDETARASHTITVDTNSYRGLSVTYAGNTLTCVSCVGSDTIKAIGLTADISKVGTSQFGFDVIYSTSTAATPRASEVSPYSSVGQYAFHSGDQIISSTRSINQTTFNANYIINIKGTEPNGEYTTTITYTATGNF